MGSHASWQPVRTTVAPPAGAHDHPHITHIGLRHDDVDSQTGALYGPCTVSGCER